MERNNSGVPMLNCLLQHTLRSLCAYSGTSSKWVYAVFWRILPRNYPPPKWDYGGSALDRSKGNKRNWILVWEDGHCDFNECEQAGRFGADVFFKMSHEVYSYGEGVVGKVAADNSHKWVLRDPSNEGDDPVPTFVSSSWNLSIEPQPRAWEVQFKSGIQTIAIISVREGIIQLGSLDKIMEDLNLVINIQRKFSYLQSIPGVFSMQRPHQNPYHGLRPNPPITGLKRLFNDTPDHNQSKSINFGWNTPQHGALPVAQTPAPAWQPLSCSLGALLSKLPSVMPYSFEPDNYSHNQNESQNPSVNVKLESSSFLDALQEDQKPNTQLARDHRSSGCSKS